MGLPMIKMSKEDAEAMKNFMEGLSKKGHISMLPANGDNMEAHMAYYHDVDGEKRAVSFGWEMSE